MADAESNLVPSEAADQVEVALDAVDQHQRRTAVDRGDAADVEAGRIARASRRSRDRESRDGALQHVGHRRRRPVLQLFFVHRGDGAREVHLFLGSVTHDHHVLHLHGVLRKEHLHVVLRGGDGDFLAHVAQIGEAERYVGVGDREREAAVGFRYRTAGVVAHERDGHARQRRFGRVVDDACDRALPGRGLAGRDQGDLAFGDGEVQPCRGEHFLQGG